MASNLIAITRPVSASMANCQLTHLARDPIDIARAISQHAAYENLLRFLGAKVRRIDAADELPDAVFVEDTAIVLDELAVITRPGAPARRAETDAVAMVLAEYRPLAHIKAPGTLDGGDVLRINRTLYVGKSSRTNPEGIEQLHEISLPLGYQVAPVEVSGCLHLKSAVTLIGPDTVLINPSWLPEELFGNLHRIEVDPTEPCAANALMLGGKVTYPRHFPRTVERLEKQGITIAPIGYDELAKPKAR